MMGKDKGASLSATGPSRAEPEVSALRASVPSARLDDFESAVFALPWVAERFAAGQQFNVYHTADNDDDDPDDWQYALCIGPITDHRFICVIEGCDRAQIVEAAMKVATDALRLRVWDIAQDAEDAARQYGFAAASGIEAATAGETQSGSTAGESPTRNAGDAQ